MNPHNSCSSKRRLLGAAVLPRCPAFPASLFPGLLCVAPHQHFCAVPQLVDPGAHHPALKGCLCVPLLPFSRKVLISFPISIPGCSFHAPFYPACFFYHFYSYRCSYCHSLRVILIFHSLIPSPSPPWGLFLWISLCLHFCSSPQDFIPPIPLSPLLVSASLPLSVPPRRSSVLLQPRLDWKPPLHSES